MPDIESVMQALKDSLKNQHCGFIECVGNVYAVSEETINDTLELLKEQEPLEPTMVEIEQAGPLYHRCYCPKCGHHVGNMIKNKVTDVHENFCSSCGQEMKWND